MGARMKMHPQNEIPRKVGCLHPFPLKSCAHLALDVIRIATAVAWTDGPVKALGVMTAILRDLDGEPWLCAGDLADPNQLHLWFTGFGI